MGMHRRIFAHFTTASNVSQGTIFVERTMKVYIIN